MGNLPRNSLEVETGHETGKTNTGYDMKRVSLISRKLITDRSSAGFTLVEVMVAAVLLVILAVAMLTTMTVASQMTRLNCNAIAAKNIAQGYFERMAIDDFADVGPTLYPDIDYDSNPPVWLDQALNIRCKVTFKFKGFGTLENSSANNLTDAKADWDKDEWSGDTVFLISGTGAGQFAIIDFNTPNTLHLAGSLAVAPKKGTKYLINHGKTVEITTTWLYLGKQHTQMIESLIINYRNSPNLGF